MKLLFFSPFCGRTGSELALYNLISHADRANTPMAIACGTRGSLRRMFPPDVQVFNYWHALSFADRALQKDSRGLWFTNGLFNGIIRLIHERVRPDAWYINTIVQPNVLALARELRIPCILHTHEFEFALSNLKPREIEDMISYPKLIIAASQCAAEVFRVLGRRNNIEVCSGTVDINQIKSDEEQSLSIRKSLNIPPDAFVWAMSGVRDIRKNPVKFVKIASEILKSEPQTHFIWIGGEQTGYSEYAGALAKSLGADRNIIWVSELVGDYFHYLNVANGFVMTSLDESLSIATLEAAALGKPFVSFNSGGPKEIFRDGMGAIVDSWNIEDMAKVMLQVMRGDVYLSPDISRARAREFDVSVTVKQWERTILTYMGT
jgi:glycosyltransferase involved in cell wall biosynthesis